MVDAFESAEDVPEIEMPDNASRCFALRVNGDSMPPDIEEAITVRSQVTGHDRATTIADLIRLGDLYNRTVVARIAK